jgi:hypothetical protein
MAHLPHCLRRSPLPRASLLPLPLAPLPQHRHLPLIMRQPLRLVAVPRPHHHGWRLFPLSISLTLLIAPNTLVLLSQLRAHSSTLLCATLAVLGTAHLLLDPPILRPLPVKVPRLSLIQHPRAPPRIPPRTPQPTGMPHLAATGGVGVIILATAAGDGVVEHLQVYLQVAAVPPQDCVISLFSRPCPATVSV